jgi:hypothetical protein
MTTIYHQKINYEDSRCGKDPDGRVDFFRDSDSAPPANPSPLAQGQTRPESVPVTAAPDRVGGRRRAGRGPPGRGLEKCTNLSLIAGLFKRIL